MIDILKKQFSRFGISRQLISDGGPQYISQEFKQFVKEWKIAHHVTSSNYPSSNGKAEAGVKIVKRMMKKWLQERRDQYEALLELRNTPRKDTGLSPYEIMFSRPGRAKIPSIHPRCKISKGREARKNQVKKSYDKKAHNLPKLKMGQNVYFENKK